MAYTKKLVTLTALATGSALPLQAAFTFTYNSTAAYDASPAVLVESADLDAAARAFIRDPRAGLQTFKAPSNGFALEGINIIVNRLFDGATATLSIFDLGTTAPGADITQATLDGLTPLLSESISITGADAAGFGNSADGWNDAASTLAWSFGSALTLDAANIYAFHLDGTDTSASIVWVRDSGNGYADGSAYYQDGNTADLRSGVFGGSAGSDDWSLALVPEPSTYAALLGLGALALVFTRRRAK